MARFTKPRTWVVELEDGTHQVTLRGWPIGVTSFGITRDGRGQVCVDGNPVPYERSTARGFVFAHLQQAWRFTIGRHTGVVKQGMAGVPIWDLWVDGRRVSHAAMDQRAAIKTAGEILLALSISVGAVALVTLLVVRLSALFAQ